MVDKYQHIAHLADEELQDMVEPCVFTEGKSRSKNGEPHRCKNGHITFMSQKGIDDIFAAMFSMKRKNAKFTYLFYGKECTMKTGTYEFKSRKKSLLKRLEGNSKTQPCAVCFAKTTCMGTNAADVDALMTACPVKLLVKEAKHREEIEAKGRKNQKKKKTKKRHKAKETLSEQKNSKCMFGETCARLKGSGDCLSGCPHQKEYVRKLQEKNKRLWQQEMQKKMEEAEAARLVEEKQKQEMQEKKKREKIVRRHNFFASRIQKMARGYLVRKHITQKAKEAWYTDLLKDKDLTGNNWPTILKELTKVEFDCEEIILDASVDDLVKAVLENGFKLWKHKAQFLLKIIQKRSDENHVIFMPSMTHHWSIMKQGPEPGLSPGSPGSPIGPPPGFAL